MINKINEYAPAQHYNKKIAFGTMTTKLNNGIIQKSYYTNELQDLRNMLKEFRANRPNMVLEKQEKNGIIHLKTKNGQTEIFLNPNYKENPAKIPNPFKLFGDQRQYSIDKNSVFGLDFVDPPSTPQIVIKKKDKNGVQAISVIKDYFDGKIHKILNEEEVAKGTAAPLVSSGSRSYLKQNEAEKLQKAFDELYDELGRDVIYNVENTDRQMMLSRDGQRFEAAIPFEPIKTKPTQTAAKTYDDIRKLSGKTFYEAGPHGQKLSIQFNYEGTPEYPFPHFVTTVAGKPSIVTRFNPLDLKHQGMIRKFIAKVAEQPVKTT